MSEGEEKSGGSQRVKVAGAAAKTFVERNVPFVLAFVELLLVLINYGLVVQTDNSRPVIAGGGEYTHIVSLALVLVALRALAVILDWFRIPLMTKEQSALSGLVVVTLLAFGTMDVRSFLFSSSSSASLSSSVACLDRAGTTFCCLVSFPSQSPGAPSPLSPLRVSGGRATLLLKQKRRSGTRSASKTRSLTTTEKPRTTTRGRSAPSSSSPSSPHSLAH